MNETDNIQRLIDLKETLALAYQRVANALAETELTATELQRNLPIDISNGHKKSRSTPISTTLSSKGIITPEEIRSLNLEVQEYGPFKYNPVTKLIEVRYLDIPVGLDNTQASIFHPLIAYPEKILTYLEVCKILGYTTRQIDYSTSSSRTRIWGIRKKIHDLSTGTSNNKPENKYIHTIPYIGYLLKISTAT